MARDLRRIIDAVWRIQSAVRAKRALSAAPVPFELPRGHALATRLAAVFEVIRLILNEGYAATAGDDWMRPALCEEALRLHRVLAQLAPHEREVHALVALMEIQASRARVDAQGRPILLLEQDRSRWDPLLIGRGLATLERAGEIDDPRAGERGPYELQAAIAACRARARTAAQTEWAQIAALRDALAEREPSSVVELDRAVAVGMAPMAGNSSTSISIEPPMRSDAWTSLPSAPARRNVSTTPKILGTIGLPGVLGLRSRKAPPTAIRDHPQHMS